MAHHPIAIFAGIWWVAAALILRLDSGGIVIATISALSPSIAVLFAYKLSRRTQKQIDEKLEAQNLEAALVADAARKAVAEAERQATAAAKMRELTNKLVLHQKRALNVELKARDARLEVLERHVAATAAKPPARRKP